MLGFLVGCATLLPMFVAIHGQQDQTIPPLLRKAFEHHRIRFHEHQSVVWTNDPTNRWMVVAHQDIRQGEILAEVVPTTTSATHADNKHFCAQVKHVMRLLQNDDDDDDPYVSFWWNHTQATPIPSLWSEVGRSMLQEMVDWMGLLGEHNVPVAGWYQVDWIDFCKGADTLVARQAVQWVVERFQQDRDLVGNLYSRRNGNWTNVRLDTSRMVRVATRDIPAGQVLYQAFPSECAGECTTKGDGEEADEWMESGTAEIFLDTGILQDYPQRWFINDDIGFEIDQHDHEQSLSVRWFYADHRGDRQQQILGLASRLKQDLDTLVRLQRHLRIWMTNNDLPDRERIAIQAFFETIQKAYRTAAASIPNTPPVCLASTGGSCPSSFYPSLSSPLPDRTHQARICDNSDMLSFVKYDKVIERKSHFQELYFRRRSDNGDVCLTLDGTLQICDNYRPYYHEYAVHYPGQFLPQVRRVLFIGGGDSMLLHEILKYPELELVVGLELDQQVVRSSFKHFKTQPHFEDDRVEWWFGDATKSLLLLPQEYSHSFDLVLVDLSETAVSLTVTAELDVLQALSLLVQPEGIMVKNEIYFAELSRMFAHSMQIFYESPMICSQSMAMGSQSIDFLTAPTFDHGIETLLFQPFASDEDRLTLLQDYKKNRVLQEEKSHGIESPSSRRAPKVAKTDTLPKSTGIFLVVDAEDISVASLSNLTTDFLKMAESQGLHVVWNKRIAGNPGAWIFVLQEGFVNLNVWPEERYAAIDISFWASFHSMDAIKQSIIFLLGSTSPATQSYRIVASGMASDKAQARGLNLMGQASPMEGAFPKPLGSIVREDIAASNIEDLDTSILRETIALLRGENLTAAVLCGNPGSHCSSLDILQQSERVTSLTHWHTCEEVLVEDESSSSMFLPMFACEIKILQEILDIQREHQLLVLDPSANLSMGSVFRALLGSESNRHEFLDLENFVLLSVGPVDGWMDVLVQDLRVLLGTHPLFDGAVDFMDHNSRKVRRLSFLVRGQNQFLKDLYSMTTTVRSFSRGEATITRIRGGTEAYVDEWMPALFDPSNYDRRPANEQSRRQHVLAHQTLLQYQPSDGQVENDWSRLFQQAIESGLSNVLGNSNGWSVEAVASTESTSLRASGSLSTWDIVSSSGRRIGLVTIVSNGWDRTDILVTDYELGQNGSILVDAVCRLVDSLGEQQGGILLAGRDDHPRGTGFVVTLLRGTH